MRLLIPTLILSSACSAGILKIEDSFGPYEATVTTVGKSDVDDDGDGYTEDDGDCDDSNADINPGQADYVGDGDDEDCDGTDAQWGDKYHDDDGDCYCEDDGYCADTVNREGCAVITPGDCDDDDIDVYPGATEVYYDDVDQSCAGTGWGGDDDQDGDGYEAESLGGDDCDDRDPEVNPGEAETDGNGVDDNCNGVVDGLRATMTWYPSAKGDEVAFEFTMTDDPMAVSISVIGIGEDFWDVEGHDLDGEGAVSVTADQTAYEREGRLTYAFVTRYEYAAPDRKVGNCFVWGERAADLIVWATEQVDALTCVESNPTTW